MAKIDIDKLAITVIQEIQKYADVTHEVVNKAVYETAKETVNELRATSPKDSGDYAESWTYKRDKEARGKNRYNMIVYSEKPNYRVTHLLEYGHAKVNGGRTRAFPHIRNAEQNAIEKLESKIRDGVAGL